MKNIFKVLLCICALSVSGAGAAYAGAKEDAIAAYDKGDYKRAARLFEPLAKHGDALAQFKLGVMYADGKGVKQNLKAAQDWYTKSADQGFVDAQYNLGLAFYKGDFIAGRTFGPKYMSMAANQGLAEAQYMYGSWFESGYLGIVDLSEAEIWYQKAADQGLREANDALEHVHEEQERQKVAAEHRLKKLADEAEHDAFMRKAAQAKTEQDARDAAAHAAAVAQAEQASVDAEKKQDDAECKSFGAAVGSPAYVQCRVSLKALRQGVLENQQKAAQDNARAGELKAQSEQQQRLTQQRADREAELQRQAAAQQQAIFEKERSDRQAMALLGLSAALLQGGAASRPPAPSIGTHTYNMNGRIVTCTTTANFTNCF